MKQSPNESINEISGETQIVLAIKETSNLLRLLSINSKNPRIPQGLLQCNNKNCKLCALYIKLCASFKISNNLIWYISSHITCYSKNVIYFLKCTSCNYGTTYIGRRVGLRSWIAIALAHGQIWQLRVLLYAEPETRTVFSNANVF